MTIGDRLRQLRTEQQWTMQEVSRHACLDIDTVLSIEADANSPTLRTFGKLGRVFDLTPEEFFTGVEWGEMT